MRSAAALLLLCAAALSCTPDVEPPEPALPPPPADERSADAPEPDVDADNLLNLAYGAAVVSRTGELALDSSAAGAIDGVWSSTWTSPPYGREQTLVFAFAAPARVSRLGITTAAEAHLIPAEVSFEWSGDAKSWTPAGTMKPEPSSKPQLFDVKPFTASFLRVVVTDGLDLYTMIRSVHAIGEEIEPARPRSIAGCWTVNGFAARFEQRGARVTGVIETEPPTFVDGGTDGRVVRAVWTRGPMWGHAVVTATPDAARLTGLEIHEEFKLQHLGAAWFGERCARPGPPPAAAEGPVLPSVFEKSGRMPLYGFAFDADEQVLEGPGADSLQLVASLAASQRIRVTAHEVRHASPEENRRRTDARVASIRSALQRRGVDLSRIDLVSAGNGWKSPVLYTALQRLLASRVDVEPVR